MTTAPDIHMAHILLHLDDGSKNVISPNKMEVLSNICFINFLPSHTFEVIEPLQTPFGSPDPEIMVKSKSKMLKLLEMCTAMFVL
jgi:hypothetical protein